jgi:acyl-CoA reductase-like NAD-dependent aldehyde dehydrogenase
VKDLEAEARRIAQRISFNQGQVCVAGSRLIAHVDIADELTARVVHHLAAVEVGPPLEPTTDYGPMAFAAQRDKVLYFVGEARKEGLDVALEARVSEKYSKGFYVTPGVFSRVASSSKIVQEEIFGPVLAVSMFTDTREAIELANSTRYGLSAYVSTRDSKTIRHMSTALKAGLIKVNTTPRDSFESALGLSHEPAGLSGSGVDLGLRGMLSYLQLRSVEVDLS